MSSWITVLPEAVSHPFAFIAYIVVVVGWIVVIVKTLPVKVLLRSIDKLAEGDRKDLVSKALGVVIPDRISASEYLQQQRQQYLLIGYVASLLGLLMFVALTVTTVYAGDDLKQAEIDVRNAFHCATNNDLAIVQEPTNSALLDPCWTDPGRATFLKEVQQGWIDRQLHACRPPVFEPSARVNITDVSVNADATKATIRADVQWLILPCNDQEQIHCSDGIARYLAHTDADLIRIDGEWKVERRQEIIDSTGGLTAKQHCNFHKIANEARTPATR